MKRFLCFIFILFVLSACSQEENAGAAEEKTISPQDVEIPSNIFISEKEDNVIDEEEMKSSIKTYLDSYEELFEAGEPFLEVVDEDQELNSTELEKLETIRKLTKENDKNFSNFIMNNTIPEGYLEESRKISQYIATSNKMLYGLDEKLNDITDDVSNGNLPDINLDSIKHTTDVVNGREQKKIEDFLDREEIDTKAFGRKQTE